MDGAGGVKAYDKSLERHHRLANSSIVVVVRLPAHMKYVLTFSNLRGVTPKEIALPRRLLD